MKADVVIVGAGPAGLVAGEHIARAGFEVLIFEKSEYPGKNKVCGGAVSKQCFLDLKLPKKIIEKQCNKIVVNFPDQKYQSIQEPGFVLFQRELFDIELTKKAEKKGAKLLTSTLVTDVNRSNDRLIVRYRSLPKREIHEASAKIIVFADGVNTLAYRKFGLGCAGELDSTSLATTCDLKWSKNPLDSLNFFFSDEISPFGYGWIFPKKDLINIGVLCLRSELKQNIWNHLSHFIASQNLDSREVISSGSRLMPQGLVEKIFGNSILITGDAAGTADPIDGGGIFNAVVSGKLAGKIAVKALKTKNATSNFSDYKILWKKTNNYKVFQRSYILQRLALKNNMNIGFFLKQKGIFDRYNFVA
jgi:digeranylgeranylglycerophospholipid reductase